MSKVLTFHKGANDFNVYNANAQNVSLEKIVAK